MAKSYRKIDTVLGGHLGHVVGTLREDDECDSVDHNIGDDVKSES